MTNSLPRVEFVLLKIGFAIYKINHAVHIPKLVADISYFPGESLSDAVVCHPHCFCNFHVTVANFTFSSY